MYSISKEFHFSASHTLANLPSEHPCSRLHGHNYVVTLHFASNDLNSTGFVIDYRELEPIKNFIDKNLDHRHLNDIFFNNPTAEYIARFLYEKFQSSFPQLYRVEVSETPKTRAIYEP